MLKLKVCGIKSHDNYLEVQKVKPDFIGLNFYKKSPRYIDAPDKFNKPGFGALTGIFVNESITNVLNTAAHLSLDYLQLHGGESPEYCAEVKACNYKIIKAFAVDELFEFEILEDYLSSCEYFLFDAKGKNFGGNNHTFNWEILKYYPFKKPFFLAGGISIENIVRIYEYRFPQLFALDVNSGFEIAPGIKDLVKLKCLKKMMNQYDCN